MFFLTLIKAILTDKIVSFMNKKINKHNLMKLIYSKKKLISRVEYTIKNGLIYLEKENCNKNGQRYRNTVSIMETSTVIGTIVFASKTLNKKVKINNTTIYWLTNSLKKLFKNTNVKYSNCQNCSELNKCNIKYFEYLSHFYYAKDTILYKILKEEFYFLNQELLKKYKKNGWEDFEGSNNIDPLATATILILLSVYKNSPNYKIVDSLKFLIENQIKEGIKAGSWERPRSKENACSRNFKVVTTHRVIEALSIYRDRFTILSNEIQETISLGVEYLKSSDYSEEPVNYEKNIGIDETESLRALGHIIQGLIKADMNTKLLEEHVELILELQKSNGSFVGVNNIIGEERKLIHHTDLTAFIVRTLCIYYNYINNKGGVSNEK